jgi:plastocyanin
LRVGELVNKFTSCGSKKTTLASAPLYGSGGLKKMRFYEFAVAVGVITFGACAGGENKPGDTTHVAVDTAAATTTPGVTSTTPAGTTGGAVAMAPITGTTKTVKFVMVSGGPHNVAFDPATIPGDVKAQLDANMGSDKMGELSSNMKMNPGESVTISFANIKPGQYPYHCVPHLALNMKGVITVQ